MLHAGDLAQHLLHGRRDEIFDLLPQAPGNGTKTLANVTSICGSSSRGVTSTAKTPSNRAATASSGVSSLPEEEPREPAAEAEGGVSMSLRVAARLPAELAAVHRRERISGDRLAWPRPASTSTLSSKRWPRRICRRDDPAVAPPGHKPR